MSNLSKKMNGFPFNCSCTIIPRMPICAARPLFNSRVLKSIIWASVFAKGPNPTGNAVAPVESMEWGHQKKIIIGMRSHQRHHNRNKVVVTAWAQEEVVVGVRYVCLKTLTEITGERSLLLLPAKFQKSSDQCHGDQILSAHLENGLWSNDI